MYIFLPLLGVFSKKIEIVKLTLSVKPKQKRNTDTYKNSKTVKPNGVGYRILSKPGTTKFANQPTLITVSKVQAK